LLRPPPHPPPGTGLLAPLRGLRGRAFPHRQDATTARRRRRLPRGNRRHLLRSNQGRAGAVDRGRHPGAAAPARASASKQPPDARRAARRRPTRSSTANYLARVEVARGRGPPAVGDVVSRWPRGGQTSDRRYGVLPPAPVATSPLAGAPALSALPVAPPQTARRRTRNRLMCWTDGTGASSPRAWIV